MLGKRMIDINKFDPRSIPRPPIETGLLTNFGRYERKVNSAQLLQNVAITIAINGPLHISFDKGILSAVDFAGASFWIRSNSDFKIFG